MRGDSIVIARGNVGKIFYNETSKGDPVVSFLLCIERNSFDNTWVKCNVYDRPALFLKKTLRKGDYIILNGELINKESRNTEYKETEIKAFKVDIVKMGNKGEDLDNKEEF